MRLSPFLLQAYLLSNGFSLVQARANSPREARLDAERLGSGGREMPFHLKTRSPARLHPLVRSLLTTHEVLKLGIEFLLDLMRRDIQFDLLKLRSVYVAPLHQHQKTAFGLQLPDEAGLRLNAEGVWLLK